MGHGSRGKQETGDIVDKEPDSFFVSSLSLVLANQVRMGDRIQRVSTCLPIYMSPVWQQAVDRVCVLDRGGAEARRSGVCQEAGWVVGTPAVHVIHSEVSIAQMFYSVKFPEQ